MFSGAASAVSRTCAAGQGLSASVRGSATGLARPRLALMRTRASSNAGTVWFCLISETRDRDYRASNPASFRPPLTSGSRQNLLRISSMGSSMPRTESNSASMPILPSSL